MNEGDQLDPAEAVRMFFGGHPLAYVSEPTEPFVCGQWMGQLAYITRIPFADAEQYFTDNPVILAPRSLDPPSQTVTPPPTDPPIVVDLPYASGPDGQPEAFVGDTITVTVGNWENNPSDYEFLWKRRKGNVNAIPGATSAQYVATNQDNNGAVFCTVLAINGVGEDVADSNDVPITKNIVVQPVRRS